MQNCSRHSTFCIIPTFKQFRSAVLTPRSHPAPFSPYRISILPIPKPQSCRFQSSNLLPMSTDESYASFLEKANQDTSSNKGTTSSANVAQIRTVDTEVPPALENVNEEYNSETERKFKPIALKWSGNGDFGIGTLLSSNVFLKPSCSLLTDGRLLSGSTGDCCRRSG